MNKKIFIVATPIGNLEDITLRALRVLREVDLVIAEDSRVTLKLLNYYKIKKPVYTFHERSKPETILYLFRKMPEGGSAAVVTDAGTPGISDPGGRLIEAALVAGFEVIPVPGPSAVTAALSVYGKRISGFIFIGYIPKKGKIETLNLVKESKIPVVFYESPNRIKKVLSELLSFVGDREVLVGRELTKKFETIYRGRISDVLDRIKERGEFVVILEGRND